MAFTREEISLLQEQADKLIELKNFASEIDGQIKELEAAIKNTMGDCEDVVYAWDRKISYKSASRTTVDSKSLKERFPEAYAILSKVTNYRVLNVK